MAKFIVVKQAPETLNADEYLIDKPSFLDEIKLHSAKKPKNGLTGRYYIQAVMDSIAQKYDPENTTAYSVKSHLYEGIKIDTDEDMDEVMVRAIKSDCPHIFPKYLEYKIRARPLKTKLVIYVDSKISFQYETFYRNGFVEVEPEKEQKASASATSKHKDTKNKQKDTQ